MSDRTKLVLAAMAAAGVIAAVALVPATPPDLASPRAAEFRFAARAAYRAASMESCPPVKEWPRTRFLARQRQALAEFESSHPGPLRAQLQMAQDDAALGLGCWADGDPEVARIHVRLARTEVTQGLARMTQLAPEIGRGFLAPRAPSPASARFRKAVRALVEFTDPACPVSTRAGNDTVLAAAQRELAGFRQELEGRPQAIDFDVARSDQVYQDSLAEPQCAPPSARSVAELGSAALAETRARIAALGKLR
ncbi:MAG: hypothetical protein J7483_08425 [Novosphingobium sp.]|nr:hypothetical protein [Novosphingobium sp.]